MVPSWPGGWFLLGNAANQDENMLGRSPGLETPSPGAGLLRVLWMRMEGSITFH